ncbi:MAG: nucleotide sugar dehydrogenase [Candidatus Omnitrophica bacterium]|nr:nucleotide sugar dehydrogenase [Candidatus Omnitrophota bacterium]
MAIAVAQAKNPDGRPSFDVKGVDLPNKTGKARIRTLNRGRFPFPCSDPKLSAALEAGRKRKNLLCTDDPSVFSSADVVVVDVPFHLNADAERPKPDVDSFRGAIRQVARRVRPGTLVIIESTVPPGTCENIIFPELPSGVLLAHSYERVMPGKDYFDSIVNFWRVYAGHTPEAAGACEKFLSKVVNVKKFPLTRLSSLRASETAKILENSYRAVNIAFMEEWGRFAEKAGIDLFEVVSAIRKRPTHSNIRQPGFGVGGYCLTKDPLLASVGAAGLLGLKKSSFPFSAQAVGLNRRMPLVSVAKARELLGGRLRGKKILLLGVSYRQDVADTRFSPSEVFVKEAVKEGAKVICHDPFVGAWAEMGLRLKKKMPLPGGMDLIVFAVAHEPYAKLDVSKWLSGSRPAVLDANHVLSSAQTEAFRRAGCRIAAIGRGDLA